MTLHTPVVFTNGDHGIARLARERGWRTLTQSGTTLTLDRVDETIEAPEARMQMLQGSLEPPTVWGWSKVLTWLKSHLHNPMPVVGPNDPATDLALWANKALGWPHAVWVGSQYPPLSTSALAAVNSALGVVFADAEAEATFRGRWPAPVRDLPTGSLVEVPRRAPVPTVRRAPGITRVLLVAYYAGPCPTVGVQRINYWFERMEQLSGGSVSVDLALATPWPDAPGRTHQVPDLGPAEAAADRGGALPPWGAAHLGHVAESARSFSQDGAFWHLALENYFSARDDEFDVVICSGNPFTYFEFAKYAKRRWYAKTVLDYRDPFALNPRVAFRAEQREAAAYAEAGFNMAADRITVVNDVCADLVVNPFPDNTPVVIRNGWDDRRALPAAPAATGRGVARLVHAGQFYAVTPPDPLVEAVSASAAELHQFGLPMGDGSAPNVVNHGRIPREELLPQLAGMDCGITFSSERGFETPTKVFDYLALGLDVLVLHTGEVAGSALATMLDGVAGVHWVRNDAEAIAAWLGQYEPVRHGDPARAARFSREASTRALIEVVQDLAAHTFEAPAASGT